MNKIIIVLLIMLSGLFISANGVRKNFNKDSLRMEWKLMENSNKDDSLFHCMITFTNQSKESFPWSGWKIYFNLRYHGYNLRSLSDEFKIKHVSGELFYIAPTSTFSGLNSGSHVNMEYTGTQKIENYQDAPSGLFWVYDKYPNVAIALNKLLIKNPVSNLNDDSVVFNKNCEIQDIPESKLPKIFPAPLNYRESTGSFLLGENTAIKTDINFMGEARYFADEVKKLTGRRPAINGPKKTGDVIVLKKGNLKPEAYNLEVKPGIIKITAGDGAGIFYGIQSLKSLLPANAWTFKHKSLKIPSIEVNDAPQFSRREFMLDVSRNFQPKQEILRILDLMSFYKLNVFHFHLTDDEGWRLQIPGLPELTDIGAKRGYPFNDNHQLHPSYGSGPNGANSLGTGFYSKDEFIEILRYATIRHILVIPEIESPGHARAAVIAMNARYAKFINAGKKTEAPKYLLYDLHDKSSYMSNQGFNDNVMNVALPSTYAFMEKVIDEIKAMFREAGTHLTMLHVGGDEVPAGSWERSPAVMNLMRKDTSVKSTKDLWRRYFQKIESMLKFRGISMNGWEELAKGTQSSDNSGNIIVNHDFIRDSIQLDAWWDIVGKQDAAYKLANAGYKVVLCPVDYFYLDIPINRYFAEPGDSWIGYLELKKMYSFIPFNYYKNTKDDFEGKPLPFDYFKSKEMLTETGKKNIVGLQAAMWAENINTPKLLEHMLLPRLLAMAERTWAKGPDWTTEKDSLKAKKCFRQDWSVFVNVLAKKELPKLDFYNGGYNYYITAAGALIKNGNVYANCELPGLTIRYTTDGSVPSLKSVKYVGPLAVKGKINFGVFNKSGRSGRVVEVINK